MKIFNKTKAADLWYLCGDFKNISGEFNETEQSLTNERYVVNSKTEKNSDGVYTRKDTFKNISDKDLTLSCLKSRFVLDGGDYFVYTQSNIWQNESRGSWQKLTSRISVRSESVRTCSGATPFLAIWNNQTNRGVAFHLLPKSSWEMSAAIKLLPEGKAYVQVEMGIDADDLALLVKPNEEILMPEIIYYEFKSKTDMDAFRLHRYCTDNMRERRLPVMYNTWLYKFDKLSLENVMCQIKPAAELGCEYFVIDAGWFGINPVWAQGIGDWTESLTFGFKGEMIKVSEEVRRCGMKFGIWLETERAVAGSKVLETEAKKYYIEAENDCYFFDFANEEAREFIFNRTCEVIDKYGAEYIKFDFNADMIYDRDRTGFYKYHKGHQEYISKIRERYPDIYLENCASGGLRMNLSNCHFDSFWHSDCQSIHDGMRLFKDAILRLPPQVFDRWTVIESVKNNICGDDGTLHNHIISTSDATFEQVEGVQMSFLKGFLSGGPLGFSCDLTSFSELHREEIKKHIKEYKENREFWRAAECHIAVDNDNMLILEFRDRNFKKVITQVFTERVSQRGIIVYPELDESLTYKTADGKVYAGKEIMEDGIYLDFGRFGSYKMHELILVAE